MLLELMIIELMLLELMPEELLPEELMLDLNEIKIQHNPNNPTAAITR